MDCGQPGHGQGFLGLNMGNVNTMAAGFFRFPARRVSRSLPVVRAERVECHATQALFRHRHAEPEPVKPLTVTSKGITPVRVPGARITVRV